jgi:hypothetical protein
MLLKGALPEARSACLPTIYFPVLPLSCALIMFIDESSVTVLALTGKIKYSQYGVLFFPRGTS